MDCNSGIPVDNIIVNNVINKLAFSWRAKYASPQSLTKLKKKKKRKMINLKLNDFINLRFKFFAFQWIFRSLGNDIKKI